MLIHDLMALNCIHWILFTFAKLPINNLTSFVPLDFNQYVNDFLTVVQEFQKYLFRKTFFHISHFKLKFLLHFRITKFFTISFLIKKTSNIWWDKKIVSFEKDENRIWMMMIWKSKNASEWRKKCVGQSHYRFLWKKRIS